MTPRKPDKISYGDLEFPAHAERYLGKEVMEGLALLQAALVTHEEVVEIPDLPKSEILAYLSLQGIYADLSFLEPLAIAFKEQVRKVEQELLSSFSSEKARQKQQQGVRSALEEITCPGNHKLFTSFISELTYLARISNYVDKILALRKLDLQTFNRAMQTGEGSLGGVYKVERAIEAAYLEESRQNPNLKTKDPLREYIVEIPFLAKTLSRLPEGSFPIDLKATREAADQIFEELKKHDYLIDQPVELSFESAGEGILSKVRITSSKSLSLFEFFRLILIYGCGEIGLRLVPLSISRINGEIALPSQNYGNLRSLFELYGAEAQYEYLRWLILEAFKRALEAGQIKQVDLWESIEANGERSEGLEESSPVEEAVSGTVSQLQETLPPPAAPTSHEEALKRRNRRAPQTLKNIDTRRALKAFAVLGVTCHKEPGNEHLILTRTTPTSDGRKLPPISYLSEHGSGKEFSGFKANAKLRRVLGKLGITPADFLNALGEV